MEQDARVRLRTYWFRRVARDGDPSGHRPRRAANRCSRFRVARRAANAARGVVERVVARFSRGNGFG